MPPILLLIFILFGLGLALIFFSLFLGAYLRRRHLPIVDEAVIGSKIPKEIDSIFYALMRSTNYGGGFCCHWCARRSKIADKISEFDNNIKRPFQIYFLALFFGGIILFAGVILQRIYFPRSSN